MSNLSFARIMYGAAQEQNAAAPMPVSNFPSNLSAASSGVSSAASTSASSASAESLLHKAWLALTRQS
jgi:hypothetical protein